MERRIHAATTVVVGLLLGGHLAFLIEVEDTLLLLTLMAASLVVAGAIALLHRRVGTPPYVGRATSVGLWGVLAVVVVLGVVPPPPVDEVWRNLLQAALIAAPMVAAGLWILRSRQAAT